MQVKPDEITTLPLISLRVNLRLCPRTRRVRQFQECLDGATVESELDSSVGGPPVGPRFSVRRWREERAATGAAPTGFCDTTHGHGAARSAGRFERLTNQASGSAGASDFPACSRSEQKYVQRSIFSLRASAPRLRPDRGQTLGHGDNQDGAGDIGDGDVAGQNRNGKSRITSAQVAHQIG